MVEGKVSDLQLRFDLVQNAGIVKSSELCNKQKIKALLLTVQHKHYPMIEIALLGK